MNQWVSECRVFVVSAVASLCGFWSSAEAASMTDPMPAPTGPYAVGRSFFDWTDPTRADPGNPGGHREIVVWVWYPASPRHGAQPTSWLPGKWGELFWSQFVNKYPDAAQEGGSDRLRSIATHAYADAPVNPSAKPYPVVLFAPGLGQVPLDYQTVIEDLASRGFVVAGVVPTYYSGFTVFSDGRVPEDRSSKGPFAIAPAAHREIVADLGFTLTQLEKLSADARSRFAGRLDLAHVGALGHSIGGSAAIQLAKDDARVKAAVDIDGTLLGDAAAEAPAKPIMVMNSSMVSVAGVYDTMLGSAQPGYHLVLSGSTHPFSEDIGVMPFLPASVRRPAQNVTPGMMLPPGGGVPLPAGGMLRTPPLLGAIDPARGLAVTAAYLGAFFGEYLQGASTSLLQGRSSEYPEITFAKGSR